MKRFLLIIATAFTLSVPAFAHAANYADTIEVLKAAGASSAFFHTAYAYAVFPTAGGGFVVGATLAGQKYPYKARGAGRPRCVCHE
jgi:hypothetical protein